MLTASPPKRRLMRRDQQVLDFVFRFEGAFPELLTPLFPHLQSLNGIHKVLSRLIDAEWLNRHVYAGRQYYVTLGGRALDKLNQLGLSLSSRRTEALGPIRLPTALFAMRHCAGNSTYNPRLTPSELQQRWPAIPTSDTTRPFYERGERLVLIDVELGGDARYRRRKLARFLSRRRRDSDGFREFTDAGRLHIVIITSTHEQATAINTVLARHAWECRTTFQTCVDEELWHWRAGKTE